MHHMEHTWRERSLNVGLLISRLLMGPAMASHGYAKIFGGQIQQLQEGLVAMGLPAPFLLAWLAALSEFVGGLCIALGLGTRVAGFFVFFTMSVAFFMAHAADPFHVKLPAYLYGAIALALIFTGAGRFALDALFCRGSKN